MKNATLLLRWPCLLQDVPGRRLLFKTNWQQHQRKPSPIISSFLNWAEETVDAAKICGGAENVVKTETQQTFDLLGFITFLGIYTPLEARVYCSHIGEDERPLDMGNSICTAH